MFNTLKDQLNQSLKCSLWSFPEVFIDSSYKELVGSKIESNIKPSDVKSLSKPSSHYSPVTFGL
jgi:hypothetical protein